MSAPIPRITRRETTGDRQDWVTLCETEDPELWFPAPSDQATSDRAVAICKQCPVVQACAQFALDNKEMLGVWGGLTEEQRRRILHPQPPKPSRTPKSRRTQVPAERTSDVRGVSWNATKKRWVVLIRHEGITHWVGSFTGQREAETASVAKCEEFGTTARRREFRRAA